MQNWEIIDTVLLSKEQKDTNNLIKYWIKHASDNNIVIQPSIEDYESTKIGDFISDSKKFTDKVTNFAREKIDSLGKKRYKGIVLVTQYQKYVVYEKKRPNPSSTKEGQDKKSKSEETLSLQSNYDKEE